MMATEIIEIDAAWAEKWTKTGVPFLSAPTVFQDSEKSLSGRKNGRLKEQNDAKKLKG